MPAMSLDLWRALAQSSSGSRGVGDKFFCGRCHADARCSPVVARNDHRAVSVATLIFLVALGALGGWLGGAKIVRPAGFWGTIAMVVTAGIGALVHRRERCGSPATN